MRKLAHLSESLFEQFCKVCGVHIHVCVCVCAIALNKLEITENLFEKKRTAEKYISGHSCVKRKPHSLLMK